MKCSVRPSGLGAAARARAPRTGRASGRPARRQVRSGVATGLHQALRGRQDGKVLLNPYLQVASKDFPAIIDPKGAPYNWVIDAEGRVGIIQEAAHPLGRTYEKGFFRPGRPVQAQAGHDRELRSRVGPRRRAPAASAARSSTTRTEELHRQQQVGALFQAQQRPHSRAAGGSREADPRSGRPGTTSWGPVFYLLEYAPQDKRDALMKDPRIAFDDPKTQARPHIEVMAGGPSQSRRRNP